SLASRRSQLISSHGFLSHHDVSGAMSDSPRTSTTAPTPNGETVSDRRRSCLISSTGTPFGRFADLDGNIGFNGSHGVAYDPALASLVEAFEQRQVISRLPLVAQRFPGVPGVSCAAVPVAQQALDLLAGLLDLDVLGSLHQLEPALDECLDLPGHHPVEVEPPRSVVRRELRDRLSQQRHEGTGERPAA